MLNDYSYISNDNKSSLIFGLFSLGINYYHYIKKEMLYYIIKFIIGSSITLESE